MSLEFNLPDKNDPDFPIKLVAALKALFETEERASKNFTPINEPLDGNQVGDVFFDKTHGKLRVVTESGIRTISLDP